MIVVLLLIAVSLLCCGLTALLYQALGEQNRALGQLFDLRAANESRDHYLDYVLRQFHLHLHDPYVARPGFAEKRCFHCHYPIGHGHDAQCVWQAVRPLTSRLYQ